MSSETTACACRCHLGGAHPSCDVGPEQPGGQQSCTVTHEEAVDLCGVCEQPPGEHQPVEGDCALPHAHNRAQHPPEATIGHCCRSCVERHKDWLREIVDLYATLTDVVLAGSIPDDTAEHKRPKKAPASPSPLRLDAWALLRPAEMKFTVRAVGVEGEPTMRSTYLTELPDIPVTLHGWAQAAYDTEKLTAAAPESVSAAAGVLVKYAATMAGLPEIDTYDAELRWVRRSLRTAHGLGQPQQYGTCIVVSEARECRGRVVSERGETPRCKRCGRRYETLDLVRLKRSQPREEAS